MSNTNGFDRVVAMFPKTEDRDFEVHGARISWFVQVNRDFMLGLTGGAGWAIHDGERISWTHVSDIDVRFGLTRPDASPEQQESGDRAAAAYADALQNWQDNHTPLSVISGPGTPLYLIDSTDHWLPIPRSKER